jgi:aldehyde dehydrogenase (NAD+)
MDWRKKQLVELMKGLKEMKTELEDALLQDLGRNQFMTEMCELAMVQAAAKWDLNNIDWMAQDRFEETEIILGPGSTIIHYEPLGVVGIYGAWNYPYVVNLKPLIQCITSGNCALIKPSEFAPASSAALKALVEKYLDNDAYQVLEGAVDVAVTMNRLRLDLICFTGSTQVGKIVACEAAKNMIPCIMELGGKCPAVVDKGVNLDACATKICFGKFSNSGQTCLAPDYVLCHYSVINKFVETLQKKVHEMFGNSPTGSDEMGKMVNEFHTKRMENLLNTAGG